MKLVILFALFSLVSCVPSLTKGKLEFHENKREFEKLEPFNSPEFNKFRAEFLGPRCANCHHHENWNAEELFLRSGIRPGHPEESGKFKRVITTDEKKLMPPKRRGALTRDDMAIFRNYIMSLKTPDSQKFTAFKTRILAPYKCLNCHGMMENEETVMEDITPGNAEESTLFQVVRDNKMPPDAKPNQQPIPKLTPADLEFVRDYINALKVPDQAGN